MSQRFTWKKAEKLKSRKRIERVFREGKSFSLFPYRVIFLLQPIGASAPGVSGGPASGPAPATGAAGAAALSASPGGAAKAPRSDWAPLPAGFGASHRHFKKAGDRNRIK